MLCRNKGIFIFVFIFMAAILPKIGLFDSYAQPFHEEIEIRSGDGGNRVETPGVIVIQDMSPEKVIQDVPSGKEVQKVKITGEESCGIFEVTGYCSCELCTGDNHLTFSGTVPRPDYTVAADLEVFPLGSRIRIGEIIYLVEDTGSTLKGNIVDIYYDTHEEAAANGRYEAEVFLIKASDQ